MQTLTTHIQHLPLAYQCAIETLDSGERNTARLNGLIDHFERAYGLQSSDMRDHWQQSAFAIAKRRFWNFDA
jgi:hypothetical protein